MADPLTILGVSYVGKEAVAIVGQFVRDILGPSARALGEGMAAPIQAWAERRATRAEKLVTDAALTVDSVGGTAHQVPGRVLFPILERGSVEEDETLFSKWVTLLASASMSPEIIPPMFPAILAELSPADARILDWIHKKPAGDEGKTIHRAIRELQIDPDNTALSLANLERLGLVATNVPLIAKGSALEHRFTALYLSVLGEAFVRACDTER